MTLDGGAVVRADTIVMALGNNPPAMPFANPDGIEIISGWSAAASEGVAKDDTVLIVGSGLTAVDAVLALAGEGSSRRASRSFAARPVAIGST